MSDVADVALDESKSSASSSEPSSHSEDKPNITVDGQKDVHLNIQNEGEETEGSIVAADNAAYPVDHNKDPIITPKPADINDPKKQSQCCLLL